MIWDFFLYGILGELGEDSVHLWSTGPQPQGAQLNLSNPEGLFRTTDYRTQTYRRIWIQRLRGKGTKKHRKLVSKLNSAQ